MRRAARKHVANCVGGPDTFEDVHAALREGDFDEIIVSTSPKRSSKWRDSSAGSTARDAGDRERPTQHSQLQAVDVDHLTGAGGVLG
jgi:hypothetical protein